MPHSPTTFVLIPGAWHGGWAWHPVAEQLRAAGHRVFTPTLPGLAGDDEREGRTLKESTEFIVTYFEAKDLREVVLVAHSWAGYPVTGAAPRVKERLANLIYLNAFVPATGKTPLDELPAEAAALWHQLAAASPDNSVLIPFEAWQAAFIQDASEEVQRLTYSLLVPEPINHYRESVQALEPATLGVPVAYIAGHDDRSLPDIDFAARLGVEPRYVAGSHEALLTRPAAVAQALLDAL